MQKTCCFDFGNTRLKCALFQGRELLEMVVLENGHPDTVQTLINSFQPDKSILASVINHDPEVETVLAAATLFHKLGHTSKIPFSTPVGKPETIGADRLAAVAAAVDLFPKQHNLVIGLGTCITYNYVNPAREFLGGSISPGMQMRFRSMHEYTALLPLVEAENGFPLIGYDTKTNLLSGVILGMAKEIDGIIDAYALKFNNFNVLLTGGDMAFFVPHLKNKIFADPYLIYKGLYAISEFNNV
ncbi:MAG: type III pantothenate kinase [Bacteroidetes bacterium 24-39-8]|jgi:type III pantothenate kinase|nr:MAG: type III pantothenate kinase [Sphingobacteriia bacterium 35-40-8]OYZ50487.1 MAG: type III pantothenate kinase [Bacteroidetes bacterium 24-39-8]OZA68493.1 MAG: type III pantothenate kinase [Sphingobacteriia bacterium 39-39-8]HQR92356.1 type III pantothenate kinase [Sediminibacterium sp.]HQS55710.1 type III pantothenate kinase [Sediminibacterium sp.]